MRHCLRSLFWYSIEKRLWKVVPRLDWLCKAKISLPLDLFKHIQKGHNWDLAKFLKFDETSSHDYPHVGIEKNGPDYFHLYHQYCHTNLIIVFFVASCTSWYIFSPSLEPIVASYKSQHKHWDHWSVSRWSCPAPSFSLTKCPRYHCYFCRSSCSFCLAYCTFWSIYSATWNLTFVPYMFVCTWVGWMLEQSRFHCLEIAKP